MYKESFLLLQVHYHQLDHFLKQRLPKVAEHLDKHELSPAMFSTQWFMTMFMYAMPFDLCIRVFDIFMLEGIRAVFSVALTLMERAKAKIITLPFEELFPFFKEPGEEFVRPIDTFMQHVKRNAVDFEKLEHLEIQYKVLQEQLFGAKYEMAGVYRTIPFERESSKLS